MLEREWQSPVDIEWGLQKNGELILFQCRPIGGAVAQTIRKHLKNPALKWTRALAEERFPLLFDANGMGHH